VLYLIILLLLTTVIFAYLFYCQKKESKRLEKDFMKYLDRYSDKKKA